MAKAKAINWNNIRVEVTQEDIDTSTRRTTNRCMIQRAIERLYGDKVRKIRVDVRSAAFTNQKSGKRYYYILPPLASTNLFAYDLGNPNIQPFHFNLGRPIIVDYSKEYKERQKRMVVYRGGHGSTYTAIHAKQTPRGAPSPRSFGYKRIFGLRQFTSKENIAAILGCDLAEMGHTGA